MSVKTYLFEYSWVNWGLFSPWRKALKPRKKYYRFLRLNYPKYQKTSTYDTVLMLDMLCPIDPPVRPCQLVDHPVAYSDIRTQDTEEKKIKENF